ncbi:hypothetical protein [Bacillus pumilus]|uniref:hypothetical protein n=1 Tax=Bacillus pumilus TaxID=1408 RepID=UPI0011E8DFF2|nr:hypothetical protein [Bacillus pumilus]TYS40469.1 hypothetical protein FZC68_16810 [Bacillus pumilus]
MDQYLNTQIKKTNKALEVLREKTIVFVIPLLQAGPFDLIIRFPYSGEFKEVYASCSKPAVNDILIDIEKCSSADIENTPKWQSVFNILPEIKSGNITTSSSPKKAEFIQSEVNQSDHFRVNFKDVAAGEGTIAIELTIKLT